MNCSGIYVAHRFAHRFYKGIKELKNCQPSEIDDYDSITGTIII